MKIPSQCSSLGIKLRSVLTQVFIFGAVFGGLLLVNGFRCLLVRSLLSFYYNVILAMTEPPVPGPRGTIIVRRW